MKRWGLAVSLVLAMPSYGHSQESQPSRRVVCALVCPAHCTRSIAADLASCSCTCETADFGWASTWLDFKKNLSLPLSFKPSEQGHMFLEVNPELLPKSKGKPIADYDGFPSASDLITKFPALSIPEINAYAADPTGDPGVSVSEAIDKARSEERKKQEHLCAATGDC